jgi:hypothetical protein
MSQTQSSAAESAKKSQEPTSETGEYWAVRFIEAMERLTRDWEAGQELPWMSKDILAGWFDNAMETARRGSQKPRDGVMTPPQQYP